MARMLSAGDVAEYDMQIITENRVEDLFLFNLLSVVEGTLVNELPLELRPLSGWVHIVLAQWYEDTALEQRDSILLTPPDTLRTPSPLPRPPPPRWQKPRTQKRHAYQATSGSFPPMSPALLLPSRRFTTRLVRTGVRKELTSTEAATWAVAMGAMTA